MASINFISPKEIRAAFADNPKTRERDLATKLGISEVELVAAHCGEQATRIDARPDNIMRVAQGLGEVMALTRNESCVHEKIGVYDNYHSGAHAAMILNKEIDLRIFPTHWKHAFLVEKVTDEWVRRSIQVFDAAGDAVHKIYIRTKEANNQWESLKAELAIGDQSQNVDLEPRKPTEAPIADPEKQEILRNEWSKMTDTHQFMRLTSKLKMNRLGAYRLVGDPYARPLETKAVDDVLKAVVGTDIGIMVFTGNRGCIQIHSGPIKELRAMGPWQNIMDPNFNLHLRLDHIAEVWAATKPTKFGPAVSVEAFDKDGMQIVQLFGVGREGINSRPAWDKVVAGLPTKKEKEVA